MRRQSGIAGHLWVHPAIAQDVVGEHREHRAARGALDAPDGKPAQPDSDVVRVERKAPASLTGRLVGELKAEGQEEGEHEFDKRLAIAKQLKIGGFILEINSDGAVFSCRFGRCPHVSPLGPQVSPADETPWG